MKKNILFISLSSVAACAVAVGVFAALNKGGRLLTRATDGSQWVHYARREATSSQIGIREYWVECGGSYQFEAPSEVTPAEGVGYDTSEFAEFDDRYFTYAMDEHYHDFSVSLYGASMLIKNAGNYEQKDYRINQKGDSYLHYSLYGDGDVFRINLPRIDYRIYPHVQMNLSCPDWYQPNLFGPEDDDLTYQTVYGGNKGNGKIKLLYYDGKLTMDFYDPEYGNLWFTKEYTDTNVINGLASPCFYVTDKWDRYLNLDNITLTKHVDDGNGFCTVCNHVIGGHVLSNTLFTTSLEPDSNPAAPTGFALSTRQSAKHNTNSYVNSIDLSSYRKLYFAVYSKTYNLKFFSGSGESKAFWTGRWNQFYMELDGEDKWHAYGKDPGEANYTEIPGVNQSSNWKWMFSIIRTDFVADEFDVFTTELIGVAK